MARCRELALVRRGIVPPLVACGSKLGSTFAACGSKLGSTGVALGSTLGSTWVALGSTAIALGGCAVHEVDPDPLPPVPVPAAFPSAVPDAAPLPEDDEAWWLSFGSPTLTSLVEGALRGSLDVSLAEARVREALAVRRRARALRRPRVDAVAAAGVTAGPAGGPEEAVELGLAGAFDVDPFAGLASEARAALLEHAAAEDDLDTARLVVSTEVASAYYDAVAQRLRLALLAEQVELDRTLLELAELRFAQGESSAVDVLQQQSQLAETRALVPPAHARLRTAENALDVLLGVPPDGLDRTAALDGESAGAAGFPELPLLPPVAVPASLLARRPDLRALQARVVAADHRVGAALAERLPRIVLSGSLTAVAGDGADGLVRALLASLAAPLLDHGLAEADVLERRAEREALLAQFGAAFLEAVARVEDLLHLERRQRERIALLEERRDLLATTVAEARYRYANGLTDYLPVLTAVSELQETERELLDEHRVLVDQRIALHLALGGPVVLPPDSAETPRP